MIAAQSLGEPWSCSMRKAQYKRMNLCRAGLNGTLHMLMACVTCSARFRLAPGISSSATDILHKLYKHCSMRYEFFRPAAWRPHHCGLAEAEAEAAARRSVTLNAER